MKIRKADLTESGAVLDFYYDLIDRMKDNEFRPTWVKDVYPTRELLEAAIRAESLYLAVEEESGPGPAAQPGGGAAPACGAIPAPKILGALIRNHTQGDGYETVDWKVSAPSERVAVLHLLAVSPLVQSRGVGHALLEHVIGVSRQAGDLAIRLDTLPWNKPGRHLYEKTGFVYCGECTLWYPVTGDVTFSMYEYPLTAAGVAGTAEVPGPAAGEVSGPAAGAPWRIRPIESKDNAQVEHVIRACLLEMGHNHPGCAWEDPDLGRFSEVYAPEGSAYWVAVNADDRVVGGAGIGPWPGMPDTCELQKLYLLPEARHSGLARRLMDRTMTFARERYRYCYLETFENMTAAMKLYEHYGFIYLDGPLPGAIHSTCDRWMRKDLAAGAGTPEDGSLK